MTLAVGATHSLLHTDAPLGWLLVDNCLLQGGEREGGFVKGNSKTRQREDAFAFLLLTFIRTITAQNAERCPGEPGAASNEREKFCRITKSKECGVVCGKE